MMADAGSWALYGKTIRCECGRTHRIDPQEVVWADNALDRLPATAGTYAATKRAAVIMDVRTGEVAGKEAARVLGASGWDVAEVFVADPSPGATPVCDEATYRDILLRCREAGIVVAVGSGVLSDLGKWASTELDLPYICFATAASMNGYSSANIAALVGGVKTVVRGKPPKAILATPSILRDAPYEMTASGLGDVLAKSVSSADWSMNQLVFGDYYCERCNSLIAGIEPLVMQDPEALARRDGAAIGALFEALLLTGVAMTMAETSAPASGGEHLVSHALDMMSLVDGEPHGMHGSQVGIGTVLVSEVYRRVMSIESPRIAGVSTEVNKPFWGKLAVEVESHHEEKIERLRAAARFLSAKGNWDRLRERVAPFLRPPERLRDCLKRARGAWRAEDIGCTRERLVRALRHAHEIRARFTVLDLARLVGVLPDTAAEIVEEWA